MEKKLSLGQNTLYNSIGSFFYLFSQWLITVLVVRLGSVEYGGILSLAMSVTNVFYALGTFSFRDYQVSDYQKKYSTPLYVGTRLFTCLCSAALCAIYVFTFKKQYTGYEALCITVYMLFRTAEAIADEFQALQQIAERMDYIFRSLIMRGALMLVTFLGTLVFSHSLLLALALMAASSFAVVLCYDLRICKKIADIRPQLHFSQSLHLMREAFPLMYNALLLSACIAIPRNILKSVSGVYTLGIYASIATPAVIVQAIVQWLYMPAITSFTRFYNQNNKKAYFHLLKQILGLMGGVFVMILIAAKLLGAWGLSLFFDNQDVVAHADILITTLLTTGFMACAYFFSALLTVSRKQKIILLSNTVSIALTLLLSQPLIQKYDMYGVNAVIMIAIGANVLLQCLFLGMDLRRHFSEAKPE